MVLVPDHEISTRPSHPLLEAHRRRRDHAMVDPDTWRDHPAAYSTTQLQIPPLATTRASVVNYHSPSPLPIYTAVHNWRRAARYLPVVHPCRRGAAGSIIDPG